MCCHAAHDTPCAGPDNPKDRARDRDASGAAGGAPTFQAAFTATRDMLFVLLARELMVFDLELGGWLTWS